MTHQPYMHHDRNGLPGPKSVARTCLVNAVFLIAFTLLLSVSVVRADDEQKIPWQITADRIVHEKVPAAITAEGNVLLENRFATGADAISIKADWLRYETVSRSVKARGNVTLETSTDIVTAREASIDLETKTGVLQGATLFVRENNLYFSGEEMAKTGESTFRLTDGWVTACPADADGDTAWSFRVREADLTIEGYAFLRDATFQVQDLPVAYTPFMVLPAKTRRNTGFLFPEFSQSERDGTGLTVPYFLNLSPSADITLYPGYLARRGTVVAAEFRYMADEQSGGTMQVSYLRDRKDDVLGDEFKSDGYFRNNAERWWLRGMADQELKEGITGHLDLDLVSDRDYLQEFRKGLTGFDVTNRQFFENYHRDFAERTIPFRESAAQLEKKWSQSFAGAEVRVVRDVTDHIENTTDTATAVQTLPRIATSGRLPLFASEVDFSWDAEYVNYWRREGMGYQRLDFAPRLTSRLPSLGMLEGAVSVGIRNTFYQMEIYGNEGEPWRGDSIRNRILPEFETAYALPLARKYSMDVAGIHELRHLLQPKLVYSYVSNPNQYDLPDLDETDRIEPENWLTYGLDNFFRVRESRPDGTVVPRQFGTLKINQTYNIREDRRDLYLYHDRQRPLSDVLLEAVIWPLANWQVGYDTTMSVYGQGVTSYTLLTRYAGSENTTVSMDFRYKLNEDQKEPFFYQEPTGSSLHELNFAFQTAISRQITTGGRLVHSLATDSIVEADFMLRYMPSCWGVELQAAQSTDDTRVAVLFSLAGLGKVFAFGKDFD